MSAAAPFKVKALFEYKSPHDDDLNFPANQIITVTEEEDSDWYIGEYADASGQQHSGLFPKNFVERYEPIAPPRPTRATRPKQAEAPTQPEQQATTPEPTPPQAASVDQVQPEQQSQSPVDQRPPAVEQQADPGPATQPVVSAAPAAAKKPPPPVAEKSSTFRDRIAAFNKQSAPPVAPFKPGGTAAFIKKPFVAPPPARNAYVPPPREPTVQKVYRRDEDPEIAERQKQDQEDAENAGLTAATDQEDGEAPKAVSLKERIALLQKQQMEQAARRSEQPIKEKPKRPAKKRTESYDDQETPARDSLDTESGEAQGLDSMESSRAFSARRLSKGSKLAEEPMEREMFSDTNDADQSAAGDTTEDAEAADMSVEEDGHVARSQSLVASPPPHEAGGEEHETEQVEEDEEAEAEEEDDLDEETRHQNALRERMAKLSGGMGMGAMFGPPGGMAMPGMGGLPARKKPPPPERRSKDEDETPISPPHRIPIVPSPGMRMPEQAAPAGPARSLSNSGAHDDESDSDEPKFTSHAEGPPHQSSERALPPPRTSTDRTAPPIPGRQLTSGEGRNVPFTAPPEDLHYESEGSESDDEMLESTTLSARNGPPPVPSRDPAQSGTVPPPNEPRSPPPVPVRDFDQTPSTSTQASDKRLTRGPPSIPLASPTLGSGGAVSRPPPPLPPGAAPTRSMTGNSTRSHGGAIGGESEYEGDYDTDIASGVKHKDALKAHAREEPLSPGAADGNMSARSPQLTSPTRFVPPVPGGVPLPGTIARAAPPPPPAQPPRRSIEGSRGPPPLPPAGEGEEDDEDYDPYRYTHGSTSRRPPSAARSPSVPQMPPPVPSQPPRQPPPHVEMTEDSEEEIDEEPEPTPKAPPRRASTDRAAPAMQAVLPKAPTRRSTDQDKSLAPQSRQSTEQPRTSLQGDQGFIARDVDLGRASLWWTQPNAPPPVFQNRSDVLYEMEENSTSRRGGQVTVTRDVYVLFQDYSQTILNARFDSKSPQDVNLAQKHEVPPPKLRQDELEQYHAKYGAQIAQQLKSLEGNVVGDGAPQSLIREVLSQLKDVLLPVGTRGFGALVYSNLANATVQQFDEIRPGDIVSFRNAKFQGKHGAMHAKYSIEAGKPDHVGIVADWDGTKKKVRALEQGRDGKKAKVESFRLGDLRSGEVRVWRVMPRAWVGWEGGS